MENKPGASGLDDERLRGGKGLGEKLRNPASEASNLRST